MFEGVFFQSLIYIAFSLLVISPPKELVTLGFSVENLLGSWLGSEYRSFTSYHQKRTAANLLVHSLLLPGYAAFLLNFHSNVILGITNSAALILLSSLFILVPLSATVIVCFWCYNEFENHPISKQIKLFVASNQSERNWRHLAETIDDEYRQFDKLSIAVSSSARLVVTDNWFLHMRLYNVTVMPLTQTAVYVEGEIKLNFDERVLHHPSMQTQLLKMRAYSYNEQIPDVEFRLPPSSLEVLQSHLKTPIVTVGSFVIHKSMVERFCEVFQTRVRENPIYELNSEIMDLCIGCSTNSANVKLDRQCLRLEVEGASVGQCVECQCRPLWCIECVSRWFAQRQDPNFPETWLSARAPCPTCRHPFCVLDVRIVHWS